MVESQAVLDDQIHNIEAVQRDVSQLCYNFSLLNSRS